MKSAVRHKKEGPQSACVGHGRPHKGGGTWTCRVKKALLSRQVKEGYVKAGWSSMLSHSIVWLFFLGSGPTNFQFPIHLGRARWPVLINGMWAEVNEVHHFWVRLRSECAFSSFVFPAVSSGRKELSLEDARAAKWKYAGWKAASHTEQLHAKNYPSIVLIYWDIACLS